MHNIVILITRHGAFVVFVVVFLEQIGAPIPAVPFLLVAGALARVHGSSPLNILMLAVAASLLADLIWFTLGRRFGYQIIGLLCRISLSPDSCVRQTEGFFERWGFRSLVFAKFIPGFSTVAPPLAGASPNAKYRSFILYDGLGATLWAGAAVLTGVIFDDAIDRIVEALDRLGGPALMLLVALLALFIVYKWWERQRFYKHLRMSRISSAELREAMDANRNVQVFDVRSAFARQKDPRRIPGAHSMEAGEIDERATHLSMDEEVVLYCT